MRNTTWKCQSLGSIESVLESLDVPCHSSHGVGEIRVVNNKSFWELPAGDELLGDEIQCRDWEIPSEHWMEEEVW